MLDICAEKNCDAVDEDVDDDEDDVFADKVLVDWAPRDDDDPGTGEDDDDRRGECEGEGDGEGDEERRLDEAW